jgi:CYTH domain-containing protein
MHKTYSTEFQKRYLIEALPDSMTRADRHIQLFDNFILGTRLWLRNIRVPETGEWTYLMMHQIPVSDCGTEWKVSELVLNETEHAVFESFEEHELRINRHFHEHDGRILNIDLFIGKLFGLNMLRIDFQTREQLDAFDVPDFATIDVTGEEFFRNEGLVGKSFEDVQSMVAEIVKERPHLLMQSEGGAFSCE